MNSIIEITCHKNEFFDFMNICRKLGAIKRGLIVFSFDKYFVPFIPNGNGYSKLDTRLSFPTGSLVYDIKRILEAYGVIRTGRFFIDKNTLFFKNENGCRQDIGIFCFK